MHGRVPPHGVCDTHGGTEEGGEAEESDEDGGHLADSVGLSGSLAVHHHAALRGETQHRPGSEVMSPLPSQLSEELEDESRKTLHICHVWSQCRRSAGMQTSKGQKCEAVFQVAEVSEGTPPLQKILCFSSFPF